MLPVWNQTTPILGNGESVPFRFTPNIQNFITPIGIEGVFTSSLMAVARCLTEPEFELDQYLSIFIRDELVTWHTMNHRPITDTQLRERITTNVFQILKRTQFLSCRTERDKVNVVSMHNIACSICDWLYANYLVTVFLQAVHANKPANQSIIDLISQASNPQKMAQMECTWMPWL